MKRVVGARPAYVWDLSQTSGKPIPTVPAPRLLRGEAPAGLWDGLAAHVRAVGFTLHDAPDAAHLGGANGVTHWLNHTVHVRTDMEPAARVKTLAHELGHVLLHDKANIEAVVHRGVAEVEAESFALMIAASHGMNTDQYTVPYVAGWASRSSGQDPVTTVKQTAARVRGAALQTLDRLETPKVPDGSLPASTTPTDPVAEIDRAQVRTPQPPSDGPAL